MTGNHDGANQLRLMKGFERRTNRTAKQQFLEEMLAVVPWDALVALVVVSHNVVDREARREMGVRPLMPRCGRSWL